MALTKEQAEALEMIPMIREMLNNIAGGVNGIPAKVLDEPIEVAGGGTTSLRRETSWNPANAAAANDNKDA